MMAQVNQDLCIGCELCPALCPDVFEMSGDKAIVKTGTVPPEAEAACREAVTSCPVEAISIEG
jgi:ferredoxin